MAMVKCIGCGKMVSDKDRKCPFCDSDIDGKIFCPDCNSSNTVRTEVGPDEVDVALATGFFGLFGRKAVEDKKKIRYVCKDCGRRFKLD